MKERHNLKTSSIILLALSLILGTGAMKSAGAFQDDTWSGGNATNQGIDESATMAGGIGYPVVYEPGSPTRFSLARNFWSDGTNLGIGTMIPQYPLDVDGDVRASGRVAFGNDSVIGLNSYSDQIFDFSHTITDFSSSPLWDVMHSEITFDPQTNLTGRERIRSLQPFFSGNDPIDER